MTRSVRTLTGDIPPWTLGRTLIHVAPRPNLGIKRAPEALWIGAKRFKSVLGRVLEELAYEGFCARTQARRVARVILQEPALPISASQCAAATSSP